MTRPQDPRQYGQQPYGVHPPQQASGQQPHQQRPGRHQTTDDVIRQAAAGGYEFQQAAGGQQPRTHRSAAQIVAVILLIVGWAALLWGTSLTLLATIQIDAIGIGAVLTAAVVLLWQRSHYPR